MYDVTGTSKLFGCRNYNRNRGIVGNSGGRLLSFPQFILLGILLLHEVLELELLPGSL